MWASLFQFYRRHKRRIFLAVGTLTTGYFIFNYINSKRIQFIEYQQHLIRQKIKKKYQQTQQDCLFTIIALLPTLSGAIYKLMPVENITKQLLSKRNNNNKSKQSVSNASSSKNNNGNNNLTLSEFASESAGSDTTNINSVINDNNNNNKDINDQDNNDNNNINNNNNETTSPTTTSDPVTKSQLWNELKIKSLTRLLTLVYSNSLLIILIKLQLNLLARKDYLETSMEAADVNVLDKENGDSGNSTQQDYIIEQSYLSLSWWLLNNGYVTIYEKCLEAIDLVFKEVNAKTELTFNEFSVLVAKTQELIDKNFITADATNNINSGSNSELFLEKCLFPPPELEALVISKSSDRSFDDEEQKEDDEQISQVVNNENFRLLVEETKDYINNESINLVLVHMVTNSISKFLNNCSELLFNVSSGNGEELEIELITKRFKLVKILSIIIKESNRISESSNSNEYIQVMNNIPELEEYTASVYSNFAI